MLTKMMNMIAPSEIVLLKVLALGFFFGWFGKKITLPKTREITNFKFSITERL